MVKLILSFIYIRPDVLCVYGLILVSYLKRDVILYLWSLDTNSFGLFLLSTGSSFSIMRSDPFTLCIKSSLLFDITISTKSYAYTVVFHPSGIPTPLHKMFQKVEPNTDTFVHFYTLSTIGESFR